MAKSSLLSRIPGALPAVGGAALLLAACTAAPAADDAPPRGQPATSLAEVQRLAAGGGIVTLRPGTYRECMTLRDDDVTIEAEGARLSGVACDGKGAIVVEARNATIRGLACDGIAGPGRNGACIRLMGSLTLDGVHFTDSEDGLLGGGGDLTIVNSLFERNGKAGRAHQVYFNTTHRLTVRNSRFLAARDQGHGIKTGAAETIIDGVTIDGTGGFMSRNIDAYNGGILRITNSILIKSDTDINRSIIGYDYEARQDLPENSITIENTLIDCGTGATIIAGRNSLSTAPIVFRNNTVRGNCLDIERLRNL